MLIDYIKKLIQLTMKELLFTERDAIVCKGFSPVWTGLPINTISLEEIQKDKINSFISIVKERNVFSMEEFLLLHSFILAQYEHVYILTNNLFHNLYPLDISLSPDTKQNLLMHFADPDDVSDEEEIKEDLDIYDLFKGVICKNGKDLLGAYNDENVLMSSEKIIVKSLFQDRQENIQRVPENRTNYFIDLIEESDYVDLVKKIYEGSTELFIRTSNYTDDKSVLLKQLAKLQYYGREQVTLYEVYTVNQEKLIQHHTEYSKILKQYWGYDSFRNFQIYDLEKLQKGQKVLKNISQEQIISDLVDQVEKNQNGIQSFRDVFVTAPTGSGKSVIFQVPAIYLAEKYNLLTIVVSPLIGLMNDQVSNLEKRNYKKAKTINSDISPIVKKDILDKVANSQYHILYLSPETLLARSDVEQLIGDRTIGMIIIDEAHIVTTWGKQFRPDYWYLGDHIRKLRKRQMERKGCSFIIGTFTATAIYRGIEDMYEETRNSLHMVDPITYLGYVKRNDIQIHIDTQEAPLSQHIDYKTDKFEQICMLIKRSLAINKKTLIYFPTVSLIEECFQFLLARNLGLYVTKYYGPLPKEEKNENYDDFLQGKKKIMLATKAFGMGIDIDDIEIVAHFAPTGNVCDYVQEIGRAARKKDLTGLAYYHYNPKDFKFIHQLHGLSVIKEYQLISVMKKIDELFKMQRYKQLNKPNLRKKNALLVDAETFSYIFTPYKIYSDPNDTINKVKTALLLIQKDFEVRTGFSPIFVRPIPLFSRGYFAISSAMQKKLEKTYPHCIKIVNDSKKICSLDLKLVWELAYRDKSFPQFKYLVYTKSQELLFNQQFNLQPVLCANIQFVPNGKRNFQSIWHIIKQ